MDRNNLDGASVLVVEDEYYLATDLQQMLAAAGASVLGPFVDSTDASRAIADTRPDFALVDLNLGNGLSFDLPRKLKAQRIPFAFVTGYDRTAIPREFADVVRIEKPIDALRMVEIAEALIRPHRV